MEKIYNKTSSFSKFVYYLFKFTNAKRNYRNQQSVDKLIKKIQKTKFDLYNDYDFVKEKCGDIDLYIMNGSLNNLSKKVLVYFHGGTFIEQPIKYQLEFAIKIAKRLNISLIIPDYKLIPEGNASIMYDDIDVLFRKINNHEIILMGDSAGGGFVLSYILYLKNMNYSSVTNVICISPWLDINLSNKEINNYIKKDYISNPIGTRYAGKLWRKNIPENSYLVSPLYGDYTNVPNITIFIGTYDLLKPDCDLLYEKLKEDNDKHNYFVFEKQGHDFAMYPTKEGKICLDMIVNLLGGNYK